MFKSQRIREAGQENKNKVLLPTQAAKKSIIVLTNIYNMYLFAFVLLH